MSYRLSSASHWVSLYPIAHAAPAPVSVHLWFRADTAGPTLSTNIFLAGTPEGGIQCLCDPSTPTLSIPNTLRVAHVNNPIGANRMYHAGANVIQQTAWRPLSFVIRDGGSAFDIYLDGASLGTIERNVDPGTIGTVADWTLYGGSDLYYAEWGIWTNYALSAADIIDLHGNKFAPKLLSTAPGHYWSLREGDPNNGLNDQGSIGGTLQVSGATLSSSHPAGIVYVPSGLTRKFRIPTTATDGTTAKLMVFTTPSGGSTFFMGADVTASGGFFKYTNTAPSIGAKYPCVFNAFGASQSVDAFGGAAWAEGFEE